MSELRCIDPSVGDAVMDTARSPQLMSREQLRHVDSCAGCRVFVERTRRLVAVYRTVQPNASEIGEARMRFAARRVHRRAPGHRWRLLPRAVTVALLLALVATAAAQIAARHNERVREEKVQAALRAAKPAHRHGHRHRHGATGENDGSLAIASDAAEADDAPDIDPATWDVNPNLPNLPNLPALPALPAEAPAPAVTAAPPLAGVEPAMPSPVPAPHAKKIAHRNATAAERLVAPPVEPAAPAATPSPSAASSSWEVAAAALRAGDHARAERALDALAEATDLRTRDAARLARAQLWMSQGRFERARADLADLTATGVTALIRQRAGEALRAGR